MLKKLETNRENLSDELYTFASRFSDAEFDSIIAQVNHARQIIMTRVIEMNENLTQNDYKEVQRIFAKFNAENAKPGEKIQLSDGKWIEKQ